MRTFLQREIEKRRLPKLLAMNDGTTCKTEGQWLIRRSELLEVLMKYCYGRTPAAPKSVKGGIIEKNDIAYAGKVEEQKILISFDTPKGEFTFPLYLYLPHETACPPVILHIAFRPVPDRYIPVEEITDNGFALAVICYQDIISDSCDGNYDQGLGAMYRDKGPRRPDEWGKIGMWAYAASRVLDYLIDSGKNIIDREHITVMGHSRLGKTALWCAAQDGRFFAAAGNDSGHWGASLAMGGTAGDKLVQGIIDAGTVDWFCETMKNYVKRENEMPYDQHFLLSLIAPRYLYIASAETDFVADPGSEFLGCAAADEAYRLLGYEGLVAPDEYPKAPVRMHDGRIGYHLRKGRHFLSRYDWNELCEFLHIKQKQVKDGN